MKSYESYLSCQQHCSLFHVKASLFEPPDLYTASASFLIFYDFHRHIRFDFLSHDIFARITVPTGSLSIQAKRSPVIRLLDRMLNQYRHLKHILCLPCTLKIKLIFIFLCDWFVSSQIPRLSLRLTLFHQSSILTINFLSIQPSIRRPLSFRLPLYKGLHYTMLCTLPFTIASLIMLECLNASCTYVSVAPFQRR